MHILGTTREMPSNRNDLDNYGEAEILALANFLWEKQKKFIKRIN